MGILIGVLVHVIVVQQKSADCFRVFTGGVYNATCNKQNQGEITIGLNINK